MSIAELRERINFNKRMVEQDTESKRQANLARKDQEAEDLIHTASKIQEAREKRKMANDIRREEKLQEKMYKEEYHKSINNDQENID